MGAAACHQDPATAEADRTRHDKEALAEPVRRDKVLDDLLRNADHQAEIGDEEAAVKLLRGDATFAADQAVRSIDLVKPESAWGRRVTAELADVLHQRQAQIAPYAAALEGTDLDAKLTAVQSQLMLEQKAMAALAHASGELEGWTPPAIDAAVLEPIHLLTAPQPTMSGAPALTPADPSPHP
jgi:hypothetical protein